MPEIGDNEVLVNVKAAYLDLIIIEGTVAPGLPLPHIPVPEGSGVVEAVGARVSRWKKGDRVLIPFIRRWEAGKITGFTNEMCTGLQASGTLAEFITMPENTLVRSPKNLTDEECGGFNSLDSFSEKCKSFGRANCSHARHGRRFVVCALNCQNSWLENCCDHKLRG